MSERWRALATGEVFPTERLRDLDLRLLELDERDYSVDLVAEPFDGHVHVLWPDERHGTAVFTCLRYRAELAMPAAVERDPPDADALRIARDVLAGGHEGSTAHILAVAVISQRAAAEREHGRDGG